MIDAVCKSPSDDAALQALIQKVVDHFKCEEGHMGGADDAIHQVSTHIFVGLIWNVSFFSLSIFGSFAVILLGEDKSVDFEGSFLCHLFESFFHARQTCV